MSTRLGEAWARLATQELPETGWNTLRILSDACCIVRAAIRCDDRMPAILVEVGSKAVHGIVEYPAARGFAVFPEPILLGEQGKLRICLVLTDRAYQEQFEALGDDVLSAIRGARDEAAACELMLSRLRAWQSFMRQHAGGLSLEEQTGLFAELLFIVRVLAGLVGTAAAIDAWKGPLGGPRDFVVSSCGVELKATTLAAPASIRVSNLAQLDESGLTALLVCFCILVQSEDGRSLCDIVDDVRQLCDESGEAVRLRLDSLLIAAGYADLHAERYGSRRMAPRALRYFRVNSEFPRLTSRVIPRGVLDAAYVIDLAACLPYEIPEGQATGLIGGRT